MTATTLRTLVLCLLPMLAACTCDHGRGLTPQDQPAAAERTPAPDRRESNAIIIHYLEIVTPDVDGTCRVLASTHGVTFGTPVPELGNARTATLPGGGVNPGRIGVRAPMRDTELPVVRPYIRVADIDAAAAAAEAAGGVIALPPTEIPGQGRIAIYILGGIEHGLWQP